MVVRASGFDLLPTFEAPAWVMKAFVVFLAFGFVISSEVEKSLTPIRSTVYAEADGARLALLERFRSLNEHSQLGIQG